MTGLDAARAAVWKPYLEELLRRARAQVARQQAIDDAEAWFSHCEPYLARWKTTCTAPPPMAETGLIIFNSSPDIVIVLV